MIPRSIQTLLWCTLYCFWCWVSADYHPTLLIDAIVTAILLGAYMIVVYVNVLVLIPKLWNAQRRAAYWAALAASMSALTVIALITLRLVYATMLDNGGELLGGFWEHYAIDLGGMTVHVAGAMAVVALVRRARTQGDRHTG